MFDTSQRGRWMTGMEPRFALALLVALAALRTQGLQLEKAADKADSNGKGEDALTPDGRKAAHAELFEKDFTVELNMTEAHVNGRVMGVQLDTDTDFTPVSIMKIRKTGLLEMWNKENPDRAVHLGDQVMKVNDILWHHNSRTFAERIKNQYKAAKEYKEGAKRVLTLYIQRPRQQSQTRFQSQREDLHRQLYSKEFTADIPFEPDRPMGWELNSSVDWMPMTVTKVDAKGLVGLWNKEHPEWRIYPGDEILKANHVTWHHNSKVFAERIRQQWANTVSSKPPTKVAMSLRVQRPRSVVEGLEDRSFQKIFTATLTWRTGSQPIGWTLKTNSTDPISIVSIKGNSVIDSWNKAHPDLRLAVGDRILKVNRAQWHHNKSNFASNLNKIVEGARPPPGARVTSRQNITLLIQRYQKVSYTRGWLVEIPAKVGQNLGLQLTATDNEFPVVINKIRTLGAAGIFNEDNPEDAVMSGDHIFKVNDVLWRENSQEFEKHLESQFTRSKRWGTMKLWVQRPEGLETESSDQSNGDYAEYSVELPVTRAKAMGWDLNSTEGAPVTISKVLKGGSVVNWNAENPLKDIQAGDQLMQVDANVWHNNTKNFMIRLTQQLEAASKGKGKKSISVLLRRPYDVDTSEEAGDNQDVLGEGDVMGAEQ